jgi:hypothetical protein
MAVQDFTKGDKPTSSVTTPVNFNDLDVITRTLVDYRALSGLVTDESTGGMRKMSMEELAGLLNVSRQTLYDRQNNTPDFWVMVNNRRAVISPQSRLAAVEETWFLKARKGEWQHLNAWLINYKPGYKTPTTKITEDAVETLADLFRKVEANNKPNVIEAEVTNAAEQQPNS